MTAPVSGATPLSTWRAVRHLFRFDLARHRVLIAAAIGVDLLAQGYAEWLLHLAPTAIGDRFGGAGGEMETALLDLAIWATTWIVTAVVVQADHPSDDRAFWRTRPVSPYAVALAKLAVLGLTFVAVPAMVNAGRLAAYGAPASAHVAAAVQIAVIALGGIVPAWGLAILTKTLPRFFAAIAVSVVGFYLLFMATLFYIGLAGGGVGSTSMGIGLGGGSEWTRSATLGWLGALALSTAGVGVLVAHYRFRRTVAALAAGAALVVVPYLIPSGQASEPPAELARLVRGPLRPARLEMDAGVPAGGSSLAILAGRLALPGLPSDVSAGIADDRVRVLVDGRDVAVNGLQQCCLGAAGPIGAVSATATTPPSDEGRSDALAVVRTAAVPDLRTKPVTLDAEATVVFMRHRLAAAIPFSPGASFRGDGYVVDVLSRSDRRWPSERTDAALMRVTVFPRLDHGPGPQLSFFEANPSRTIVNRATAPYPVQPQPSRAGVYQWAQARRWAMRFHSIVLHAQDVGPDPCLLIVESRSAGEVSARVAWDGGPASPR
jgi:hypothetical protein